MRPVTTGLAVAVILAELNVLITVVWGLGLAALISSIWAPVSRICKLLHIWGITIEEDSAGELLGLFSRERRKRNARNGVGKR